MPNIPGATNILPGVVTDVVTQSRGLALPGGVRVAALMGEGSTDETLVSQANGNGNDGLDSTYTTTTGSDGRHFRTIVFPLISNRTTLYKNGIPLVGLEQAIDDNGFSNKYDYRIDISNGQIELQSAALVDQGGAFYVPLSTNTGDGYLGSLALVDVNAPQETWTIRCVSVQRNSMNNPVADTAQFLAFGSVSGAQLDANGNPIVWKANGTTVSNGIIRFAIFETKSGGSSVASFVEGDAFTVKVSSGVLSRSDSLTANYIPTSYINDPVLLQGMNEVVDRHGLPSLTNNLALGAQLAFANGSPALVTVQAAPAMPRRQSYQLVSAIDADSEDDNEFTFPLPAGVTPDSDTNIHFFIQNNTTNIETQILPNKFAFYTLDTSGQPTTTEFINDALDPPSGNGYSYTVKLDSAILANGEDGYLGRLNSTVTQQGVFSSSVEFDSSHVGKTLRIIGAADDANNGEYTVTSVVNGDLRVTHNDTNYATNSITADGDDNIVFTFVDPDTGEDVYDGYAGTDGYITGASGNTATFGTAAINFSDLDTVSGGITGLRVRLTNTTAGSDTDTNDGLYDIVSLDSDYTITIRKAISDESSLRYELVDDTDTTSYVVINKSVVPDGFGLRITLIDTKEADFYDAGWVNALESLEAFECDIVVPLPKQTISVIFQNALAHCQAMSLNRNRKERVLFAGAINGLTPDNLTGVDSAAVENIGILEGIQGDSVTEVLAGNIEDLSNYSVSDAFGSTFRCVYFYPDQIVVSANGSNLLVDGFYIAAAAAGYLARDTRIENPLTNKVLSGFTILRNKQFSQLTLENLAAAGVTTLQPVSGGGRVVWGITTSQSGFVEEQEISIVFIRDRVAKVMRSALRGLIGTAETADTQNVIAVRANSTLNGLVSQNIITQHKDLTVQRDTVDPRQWNVTVRVQPPYPVNWIYIKVSIGQI